MGLKRGFFGCLILACSAGAQTVTYSEQIAPIVYNNCTTCHRTGQVTPFTLMSYSDVKQHAPTIASVTQSKYMPPWKPESGWTALRNRRTSARAPCNTTRYEQVRVDHALSRCHHVPWPDHVGRGRAGAAHIARALPGADRGGRKNSDAEL